MANRFLEFIVLEDVAVLVTTNFLYFGLGGSGVSSSKEEARLVVPPLGTRDPWLLSLLWLVRVCASGGDGNNEDDDDDDDDESLSDG